LTSLFENIFDFEPFPPVKYHLSNWYGNVSFGGFIMLWIWD